MKVLICVVTLMAMTMIMTIRWRGGHDANNADSDDDDDDDDDGDDGC